MGNFWKNEDRKDFYYDTWGNEYYFQCLGGKEIELVKIYWGGFCGGILKNLMKYWRVDGLTVSDWSEKIVNYEKCVNVLGEK